VRVPVPLGTAPFLLPRAAGVGPAHGTFGDGLGAYWSLIASERRIPPTATQLITQPPSAANSTKVAFRHRPRETGGRAMATQEIHFATACDGVRLAWARSGEGPPLVKAANWLNHLEFDWKSPVWRHWLDGFAENHTLIRYDERGNGLSDWQVDDFSIEVMVRDLEAVVEAAGLDRFALLGISQGASVGISYAVRHPGRITHLVLLGGYARGWARRGLPGESEQRQAMLTLTRLGWGRDNPAFRQVWSSLYAPEATPEQMEWFNDLQRVSTSPDNAVKLQQAFGEIDVSDLLPLVTVPTLVLHAKHDGVVPFVEGQRMAQMIPGARFVPLDSRNHILLPGEPAATRFADELNAFLGTPVRKTMAVSKPGETSVAIGDVIGPYEVTALVGRGGMGQVYRARDRRLGRDVAIKCVKAPADRALARLVREARFAAGLSHPAICTVFDVVEDPERAFIVMELVGGRPLSDVVQRDGRLPARDVAAYGVQVAEALEHAHGRGVLHRDLKSANVMVGESGRAKVLDFGLATRLRQWEGEATTIEATEALSMAGTLAYLPPEALRAEPVDERSDIWALGVMLHEMAAGELPFDGSTPFALSSAILERPPRRMPSDVPAGLRRVIARCLQKEPARRYQGAGEVRAALEPLARANRRGTRGARREPTP
jgi:pimeloyl-ACP methyl ester carboxylesterase/predicted Ser/Thr protein kinase